MGVPQYSNEFNTIFLVNAQVRRSISCLCGSELHCLSYDIWIGNWNVQGFFDLKLENLQSILIEKHLSFLCMIETYVLGVELCFFRRRALC